MSNQRKYCDVYSNGEEIGHAKGEELKYSKDIIKINEICCHHCGGGVLSFGHLSWGKLESTKEDTVRWGVGPQAYDILHVKVWCAQCGLDKPFYIQIQQYTNLLRVSTVPYTFKKTFDEIRSEVEAKKLLRD